MKTIRMKKADLDKWLAALRGGEYKQARHALYDDGAYCCLGVLQHCLTGKVETLRDGRADALPTIGWLVDHGIQFRRFGAQLGDILHHCVRAPEFLAPGTDEKEKPSDENIVCASGLNDAEVSFTELADLIEQYAETYE